MQLLANLVNKIDIASQDYAENIEMISNIASLFLVLLVPLSTKFSEKILKLLDVDKIKNSAGIKTFLNSILGILPTIIGAAFMADIQKQGSRVGRFKIKQELAKNPNNFAYVEDEKIKEVKEINLPKEKNLNIFKFLYQAFSDNKEYKKYLKTKAIENKKNNEAIKQLNLTNSQLKEAKRIQFNTFKMFNEVDDMSQRYSESVEAVGEIVQNTIGTLFKTLGIVLGGYWGIKNVLKNPIKKITPYKMVFPLLLGGILGALPSVLIEVFTTKEQKKASRIANMMAIKNMDDYRNFADYYNLTDKFERGKAGII